MEGSRSQKSKTSQRAAGAMMRFDSVAGEWHGPAGQGRAWPGRARQGTARGPMVHNQENPG